MQRLRLEIIAGSHPNHALCQNIGLSVGSAGRRNIVIIGSLLINHLIGVEQIFYPQADVPLHITATQAGVDIEYVKVLKGPTSDAEPRGCVCVIALIGIFVEASQIPLVASSRNKIFGLQ